MELTIFQYEGKEVILDPSAQMWNLNAMHQAAGGLSHKRPAEWMTRDQTQELLAALARKLPLQGGSISVLVETREGRNGGTWAHWQIAAAYAHYLKPEFYLQWNEWAMERVTGKGSTSDLETRMAAIEEKLTAMHHEYALVPVRRVSTPTGRASLSRTYLRILAELERLSADGDMVAVAQLYTAIPEVSPSTLRVALQRLRNRGIVQNPAYGCYTLKMA